MRYVTSISSKLSKIVRVSCGAGILMLCSFASSHAAGRWISESATKGEDGQLCREVFIRLQKAAASKRPICAVDAVETYAKFSEPPWQKLDPASHQELLAKLMKYRLEGARLYFKDPAKGMADVYKKWAQDFIERGGEMHLWKVRLMPFFDAGARPAPPGLQTVIRLTKKFGIDRGPSDSCPGKSSHGWVRSTVLVLPDLSGPDPQVDIGTAGFLLTVWPVLKAGVPFLVNSDSVYHPGHGSCRFKFVEAQPTVTSTEGGK